MTLSTPMRCSALAEELREPVTGTVDQRRRLLLIEDRSAWGAEAVRDQLGPDDADLAKRLGMRVLLVRRREGDPTDDVVRRVMLIDTVTREMAVRFVAGIGEVSVQEAASEPVAEFGPPFTAPMFLVCTNGKRDACCALRGRALVNALAVAHGEQIYLQRCTGCHDSAPASLAACSTAAIWSGRSEMPGMIGAIITPPLMPAARNLASASRRLLG